MNGNNEHTTTNLTIGKIQSKIIPLPNRPPAMLAQDVAEIYETETRRVNEAVSRNPLRFPEDFCFQATADELEEIWSQSATKIYGGEQKRPWLFTEMGCNQLSAVLNSQVAIIRSVQITRAFTTLAQMANNPMFDVLGPELYNSLFGNAPPNFHAQSPPPLANIVTRVVEAVVPEVISQVMQRIQPMAGGVSPSRTGRGEQPWPTLSIGHVLAFIDQRCRLDVEAMTVKETLFRDYVVWCAEQSEIPYGYSNFCKALYQTGYPLRSAKRADRRNNIITRVVRGKTVAKSM